MEKRALKGGRHPGTFAPERLALLIAAFHENEADGEIISGPEIGTLWIRRFSEADAKRARNSLSKGDFRRFSAVVYVKDALANPYIFGEAVKRLKRSNRDRERELEEIFGRFQDDPFAMDVGKKIAPLTDLSPLDSYRHLIGLHEGKISSADIERVLSREVANVLSTMMYVEWREKGKVRPAFFVLDEKTALYAHQFAFRAINGCHWCICPWCRLTFFQNHPLDVYCSNTCKFDGKKTRQRYRRKNQQIEI